MDWNSELKITRSKAQGRAPVTILHLDGRINMSNSADLEQAAREAFNQGGDKLLLDMGKVDSISSAGLRAILAIYKMAGPKAEYESAEAAQSAGRSSSFKLANFSPEVLKVLRIAGFAEYLAIYDSTEEAVAAF